MDLFCSHWDFINYIAPLWQACDLPFFVYIFLSLFFMILFAFFLIWVEGRNLILKMTRRRRPQTAPLVEAPATSGADGGGETDPIVRLKVALRRWHENYCEKICNGRNRCVPKCLTHMSKEQQNVFVREFLKKCELEGKPYRINCILREANNLSTDEDQLLMEILRGNHRWDLY